MDNIWKKMAKILQIWWKLIFKEIHKSQAEENYATAVFLPGESDGQRSLAGYCPWGCPRVGQMTEATQHKTKFWHVLWHEWTLRTGCSVTWARHKRTNAGVTHLCEAPGGVKYQGRKAGWQGQRLGRGRWVSEWWGRGSAWEDGQGLWLDGADSSSAAWMLLRPPSWTQHDDLNGDSYLRFKTNTQKHSYHLYILTINIRKPKFKTQYNLFALQKKKRNI